MKKKILAATFVTACLAGCAFGLAACGGSDDGGDNSPYFAGLSLVHNNADQGWGYYNIGQIVYGTSPDLNYQIYAKYSDGSSIELTSDDYSVSYTYYDDDIASLPDSASGYELGLYQIHLEHSSGSTSIIAFEIVGAPRKNINIQMKDSWRYCEAQPTPTLAGQVSEIDQEEVKYGYISVDELEDKDNPTEDELARVYVGGYSAETTVESRLLPGDYYMVAEVPASGKFATTRVHRKFTVNKGQLSFDTENILPTEVDFTYSWYDIGDLTLNRVLSIYYYTAKNRAREDVGVWVKAVDEDKTVNYSTHKDGANEQLKIYSGYEDRYENIQWEATVTVHKYVFQEFNLGIDIGDGSLRLYDALSGGGMGPYREDGIDVYYQGSLLDLSNAQDSSVLLENPEKNKCYTYTLKLKDKDNHVWSNGTSEDLVLSIMTDLVCPIELYEEIPVTVGTPVSALYEAYPTLDNDLGKWELYMWTGEGEEYIKLEDTDTIPAADTYTCKLVFVPKPEYADELTNIGDVRFYLVAGASENS